MMAQYAFYLRGAYIWGIVLLFFSIWLNLYATTRALLLLVAFLPIVFVHLMMLFTIKTWRIKKSFLLLTILWSIKYITFAVSEGVYLFLKKEIPFLDWIDLVLLLIIGLAVSISFLIKNPFFFERDERKLIVFMGFVGLILSVGTLLIVGSSLFQ